MSLESDRRQLEAKQRKHDEYQRKARGHRTDEEKKLAELARIRKVASGHAEKARDMEKKAAGEAKDIQKLKARIAAQEKKA